MPNVIDSPIREGKPTGEFCHMRLKDRLKTLLEVRGMTAASLSRLSGVSKQVISLWLSGSSPKKLDQLKRVADALGVTVDELCFGPPSRSANKGDGSINPTTPLSTAEIISGCFEVTIRRIK